MITASIKTCSLFCHGPKLFIFKTFYIAMHGKHPCTNGQKTEKYPFFAPGKHFANEIFDEINKVKLGNTNTAFKSFVKKNSKLKNEVPFLL